MLNSAALSGENASEVLAPAVDGEDARDGRRSPEDDEVVMAAAGLLDWVRNRNRTDQSARQKAGPKEGLAGVNDPSENLFHLLCRLRRRRRIFDHKISSVSLFLKVPLPGFASGKFFRRPAPVHPHTLLSE